MSAKKLPLADALFFRKFERVDHAQPVDDAVGQAGRDHFAPQAVSADFLRVCLAHRRGEARDQQRFEHRIIGQIARFNGRLQRQLGRRQQHCQFRPGQPLPISSAAHERFAIGNAFGAAVEIAEFLQPLPQQGSGDWCRYLAEIEEPLRNHPHVRFIWAHAGTSMEIHRHQQKLDFLLPTLQRLLGDTSWAFRLAALGAIAYAATLGETHNSTRIPLNPLAIGTPHKITTQSDDPAELTLTDVSGRVVYHGLISSNTGVISTAAMAS